MSEFLIFGVILTVLLAAGGAFALWLVGRSPDAAAAKRRHREEARLLQVRLRSDDDYARNFHPATQNEFLETLQTLDYLKPRWDEDGEELREVRFKNELAASFPTLRRKDCAYPCWVPGDVPNLNGEAEPSDEAQEAALWAHMEQQAQLRAEYRAVRARENALHQMSALPSVAPVTLAPGSLPFRASEKKQKRRPARAGLGAAAALIIAAGAYFYVAAHPEVLAYLKGAPQTPFQVAEASLAQDSGSSQPAPSVTPAGQSQPPTSTTSVAPGTAENFPGAGSVQAPSAEPSPAESATTVQTGSSPAPLLSPVPPSKPTPDPRAVLAQRIAESKLRAIDKYPALTVPSSEINTRFVFRYKKLAEEHSQRLQEPDWPEKLAEECANAAGAGTKGKRLTPSTGRH